MKRLTAVMLFSALLAGPSLAGDKETIQSLDDAFSAAVNHGDIPAVVAMYAPDAVILPPGSEPLPASAASAMFTGMAGSVSHFQLTANRVDRISPDYIREIGAYSMQTRATPPQTEKATYVVIWKRVSGQWKLWTDVFH